MFISALSVDAYMHIIVLTLLHNFKCPASYTLASAGITSRGYMYFLILPVINEGVRHSSQIISMYHVLRALKNIVWAGAYVYLSD